MADRVVDNPIIDRPYEEPSAKVRFDDLGITNEIIENQRPSPYYLPVPRSRTGTQQLALPELTADRIRSHRSHDHAAARDWSNPPRYKPVLFCQREPAGTAIYLPEAAQTSISRLGAVRCLRARIGVGGQM